MLPFFKILIFIVILTSFQSCTKVIEIDLPPADSKIVVNSLFTDGKQIKVHLSKSISVLDNSIPECNDATIILLKDNVITDTLFLNGGYYYSHVKAERGKKYSLVITAPEMDSVTCNDVIPEKTILQNYSLNDSVMINEDGFSITTFELNFIDQPGPNYYEISMVAEYPSYGGSVSKRNVTFEKNSDPVLTSTGLLDYRPQTLIFSDYLFDEKSYSLKVNYSIYADIPKIGNGPSYGYKLYVSFRAVSESYYKYKEKQIVYLFGLDPDIFSGTSEPVQLFSNIKGGYGIFAGYSSDDKTIDVIVR
jgi:hypothetical protein